MRPLISRLLLRLLRYRLRVVGADLLEEFSFADGLDLGIGGIVYLLARLCADDNEVGFSKLRDNRTTVNLNGLGESLVIHVVQSAGQHAFLAGKRSRNSFRDSSLLADSLRSTLSVGALVLLGSLDLLGFGLAVCVIAGCGRLAAEKRLERVQDGQQV